MTDHCQLYLLTPPVITDVPAFCETLETALKAAPVACLQIRLKDLENSALIQAGKAITAVCHAHNVEVILNDHPDLVADIGADGAHIGQEDMDYFSSREVLGGDAIIGVTCHNSKELAFAAAKAGADYVAFGAFFETPTKDAQNPRGFGDFVMVARSRRNTERRNWRDHSGQCGSRDIGGRGLHRGVVGRLGTSGRARSRRVALVAIMLGALAAPLTVAAAPTLSNPEEITANFDAASQAFHAGQFREALRLAETAANLGSTDAAVMAGYILRYGKAGTDRHDPGAGVV